MTQTMFILNELIFNLVLVVSPGGVEKRHNHTSLTLPFLGHSPPAKSCNSLTEQENIVIVY